MCVEKAADDAGEVICVSARNRGENNLFLLLQSVEGEKTEKEMPANSFFFTPKRGRECERETERNAEMQAERMREE